MQAKLVHEALHIAQATKMGKEDYLAQHSVERFDAFLAGTDVYDYGSQGYPDSISFENLTLEAQGQVVEDRWNAGMRYR
ncbi:hypothetical protein [Taklimakanibacter lacteus]|uniref:hypothetical protein n=1 Tax=Taklimakanibacter lacteus TaxID=2268456 RepID=UPI0013C3F289